MDSKSYWIDRYASGLTSGEGSYGKHAEFKAEVLNHFVSSRGIRSVIEFGSGDGNQLTLATYPTYLGFDVSPQAVERCKNTFSHDTSKSFHTLAEYSGQKAELAVSLDVLYHLVEEDVYEQYLRRLFDAAEKYVIIYAANIEDAEVTSARHEYYRKFTPWISHFLPEWKLIQHMPNRYPVALTDAEFFIYERT